LYDTLTRRKREFQPVDEGCVKVYVCGPTVYAPPHIGNARPSVVFDVLVRLLRRNYPKVKYARNITDVDDKILAAALETGKSPEAIAQKYTDVYHEDMDVLGVTRPDIEPKVTDNMGAIIAMITRLLDEGHAYEAEGHVLFDVTSYKSYGDLSKRDREGMIAGARVEKAPYKRDPADFVLWKPSTNEQAGWESAWGRGRPGWHIECSAMIKKHLGETIDIHGGGIDLIFPHHENECAQSFCAHQKPLANYWMHNGFVNMDDEKMSKSEGNILTIDSLVEKNLNTKTSPELSGKERGEVVRYALLTAHYRKPLDWNRTLQVQSRLDLNTLYSTAHRARGFDGPSDVDASLVDEEVVEALEDDLNTPMALQALSRLVKEIRHTEDKSEQRRLGDVLVASGCLLGLLQTNVKEWFPILALDAGDAGFKKEVEKALEDRTEARKLGKYEIADRIRDRLAEQDVILEDKADGTTEWSIRPKVETK
ncbi:MAG: cysteine--tRNA ligase, partial [Hyphomicrobiales bacterium]|nr:cysteine--tRNA ligase [Hyphomicrobiales bacterium]